MGTRISSWAYVKLRNRMVKFLFTLRKHKLHIKQVHSFSSPFSFSITKYCFSTINCVKDPSFSFLRNQSNKNQINLSLFNCFGIAQSVISKCEYLLKKKVKDFANSSLKELLLEVSDVIPEITRRFWRVSGLKPEDVLDILLGFQSECVKVGFHVDKVRCVWEIFKWANEHYKGFKHLPHSCEVMASMLVRVRLLREAELLLSTVESQGVSLDSHEVFSNLIEGYVAAGELDRSILVYDRMKSRGLVPPRSSYCGLLNLLLQRKRFQLASHVAWDMVDMAVNFSDAEKSTLENVIRLLCNDGKIQEARNLVKKFMDLNCQVSNLVLEEFVSGYCEKKDFEDILSFFVEIKCAPSVMAGNRVVHSLCDCYGTERASLFIHELENVGFCPSEITFGILIGWSCLEGKLSKALTYMSTMLSKGLVPHTYSYNALISGVCKEGLWKHAQAIFDEMIDRGAIPDLLTFKVLLAGYCKARQFDEVKRLIYEMVSRGLIQLHLLEDPLSKAFIVLGLNPLAVRLKRDNDVGLSKTEFFDNLGNGLYLDTDLDAFDKRITVILEDSMVPDFNSIIRKECSHNNLKTAQSLVGEMACWGQELSLPIFSELVRQLCSSRSLIKVLTMILEKMTRLANQLDQETLNLVVQAYSNKGLTFKAKIILDEMLHSKLDIKNKTYTSIVLSLCKKGNSRDLLGYWGAFLKNKWCPGLDDFKRILECLCHGQMLREALQLLEMMLSSYPHLRLDICHAFLETISATGFTDVALAFLEELKHCFVLDRISYSHILRGLCNEGKFSVAITILDNMILENLIPCLDVSVSLIPKLCKVDRCDIAVALKDLLLKGQSSNSCAVHGALVCGYSMTAKVQEAGTLFQDMMSKGLNPDTKIYNMLVQGHCQANNLMKVRELLGVAIRNCLTVSISAFRNLVRLMCMEDRLVLALSLKDLMLGQRQYDALIIYNILIFYLVPTGRMSIVNNIIVEMEEKKFVQNEFTYNFLVYGFSQCKDLSSSVHYLSIMISKELKPSNRSLRIVISSLCNIGELQTALDLSREMELRGWTHDSIIQNAIIEGLLSLGKLQEAEKFVGRMMERDLIPDSINYDNLIKLFCQYGRLNKAVDLMDAMLKKCNVPNSTSYDSVIYGFCAHNKLDTAMAFHAEMLNMRLNPSIDTWEVLVHNLCQNGQTAEAELLLLSMVEVGETPSRKMYCCVINRCRIENNLRKASELMQAMQQVGYEPDFETHWSLISNLNNPKDKDSDNRKGFLSRLLSISGFAGKKGFKG